MLIVSVAAEPLLAIRPEPARLPKVVAKPPTSSAPVAPTDTAPAKGSALATPICSRPAETVVVPV